MSESMTTGDLQQTPMSGADRVFARASSRPESPEQSMRVCYYLFFPGEGSGIGKYSHEVMQHLAERSDVRPTLVCCPTCHWKQFAAYPCWPGLREISHPRPFRRRLRFLAGQFINPFRFVRYASQQDADILHFGNINQITFPIWQSSLRRFNGCKVATVHDVFRQKGIVSVDYDNRQLSRFYCSMDALFVHGKEQVDQLASVGVNPERVVIVPHGPYDCGRTSKSVRELRDQYGLRQDRQVALAFGNVRDDKNLELLIRAVARQSEPVQLLVAGKFGENQRTTEESCRRLADELGAGEQVTFLNQFIESERIPGLFKLCDWVALPYSKSFTSQSGVFAVAMQYDRPVVASRVGSATEILERCRVGVGVEPDDLGALQAGIAEIIGLVEEAARFEFERYRSDYSWRENARITCETYRQVLTERRPH